MEERKEMFEAKRASPRRIPTVRSVRFVRIPVRDASIFQKETTGERGAERAHRSKERGTRNDNAQRCPEKQFSKGEERRSWERK